MERIINSITNASKANHLFHNVLRTSGASVDDLKVAFKRMMNATNIKKKEEPWEVN
jgi:hypothetical protein